MCWVYILECGDGTLYTGMTYDVPTRLQQHRSGRGALYTRLHGPLRLVAARQFRTRLEAAREERALKRASLEWKLYWVSLHPASEERNASNARSPQGSITVIPSP